jgi:hypothetical protein
MARTKAMPAEKQEVKMKPEAGQESMPTPEKTEAVKELPKVGVPENTVVIGGKLIEIKPTKLKYQRNRTAVFYHILEMYPLADVLAMGANSFGDGLDGDKKLYDWLVAVTDDEELIREHYDEIDSDMVYRMLEIFRRVNKISELEEKLKNAKTPGEA